jgi:hypothetical protein
MDRAVATEIMDILAAGQELGALDTLSLKISDDEERRAFRRTLAQIMGLYTDLIVSVAHQYPDLDPDSPAARASESRT